MSYKGPTQLPSKVIWDLKSMFIASATLFWKLVRTVRLQKRSKRRNNNIKKIFAKAKQLKNY